MATVSEMRKALRQAGEDVPDRGRLNAEHIARYEELTDQQEAPWDVADDDPDGLLDTEELEPSVPMVPEQAPRTARSARAARRSRPIGERLLGPRPPKPKAAKGAGKAAKRISVDHLIARTWEGMARFAAPLSLPVSKCLQVQSPVAGMILEDIVRGTVVDKALQPIARAEEKAEKVLALVAPPVLVMAIEQSRFLPPQQMMMRQALLVPMLKESLRIWIQVAGPKVEEAARREADYQERFGNTIDEMMAMFFAEPPTTTVASAESAEPEMAGAAA